MNRKMFAGAAVTLSFAVLLTACGGSSNPASPSSPAGALPGASLTGTVSGTTSGSSAGYQKLDAGSGITVTISGTNLTVATDSNGKFTFTGVPAGTIQLIFTGPGGAATLTLDGVQETDKIVIHVTLKGGTATLDTEERNGSPMTELEDQITAVNPAGTTRTIDVGATRVSVPITATIRHGSTNVRFEDLKVGDRVHVRGGMTGALMVATEVMVQNTNTNVGVNATGTVSGLKGACKAIEFTVSGWTVQTNDSTDFQKLACGSIANGTWVHVKGDVQAATGKVLASWVQGK